MNPNNGIPRVTPGLKLEAFKFGLCFGIPFALVAAFSNADFYEYVMKKTQYLVFPPEQNRDLLQQHMMEHNLAAMKGGARRSGHGCGEVFCAPRHPLLSPLFPLRFFPM
eukprot:tig00021126_g18479.t1